MRGSTSCTYGAASGCSLKICDVSPPRRFFESCRTHIMRACSSYVTNYSAHLLLRNLHTTSCQGSWRRTDVRTFLEIRLTDPGSDFSCFPWIISLEREPTMRGRKNDIYVVGSIIIVRCFSIPFSHFLLLLQIQ